MRFNVVLLEVASAKPKRGFMKPTASYSAPRLRFYADIIEPLPMGAIFEIISPDATWQMTKADFYRVFPNVVTSKSYTNARYYHYPKPPEKAEQFRVRGISERHDSAHRLASQNAN